LSVLDLLAYTPLIDPMPIWVEGWVWSTLLIPLCIAVAVVYKTVKCKSVSRIPIESAQLFVTIVLFMLFAAAALSAVTAFAR